MKKIIDIEGMSCEHCKAAVEKALGALDGVSAKVDLKRNRATVSLAGEADDGALRRAVEEAGFKVTGISEKKGLFG